MTSNEEFNCIFCKESFQNKEDLQIHFRKHGDPKFNHTLKQSRSNDMQSGEKSDCEMVSCDVCPEVFPTISKAITHKHKVHPDHDAKYFCPWCGKLFTMKHLYNKHIESSHESKEDCDKNVFHCDYCEVDFFVPSAMVYHNKFFHRQDTELAAIGQSRKLKMFNQEPLPIYYCPFCGEEYYNKVNLHKHMGDDHSDENQSPDDVLRCPLCDAVFYHLDAYEVHLTFHSTEDIYTEESDLIKEVTEFSLEAVPPLMEKVENDSQEDAEATMNSIGIENFLQQAMNESMDNENSNSDIPEKRKKHKKHKKSKKSAITLDEFFNMNKDVFGEGIDIQGIEEVPTQVVAKQLKKPGRPKIGPKAPQSLELEKLKKQGIVIKSKSGTPVNFKNKPAATGLPINKTQNKPNLQPVPQNKPNINPKDVLSKLINQSNSQLKIVKKSSSDNLGLKVDKNESFSDKQPVDDTNENGNEDHTPTEIDTKIISPEDLNNQASDSPENTIDKNINSEILEQAKKDHMKDEDKPPPNIENAVTESTSTPNNRSFLQNVSSEMKIKSVPSCSDAETLNNDDIERSNKPVVQTISQQQNSPKKTSLDVLKHLSHLVVKSVNQTKSTDDNITDDETKVTDIQNQDHEDSHDMLKRKCIDSKIDDNKETPMELENKTELEKSPKTLNTLKNLSKHLTIKSLSQSPKLARGTSNDNVGNASDEDHFDEEMKNNYINNDVNCKHDTGNKLERKFKQVTSPNIKNNSPDTALKYSTKEMKLSDKINTEKLNSDKNQSCANIMKQLPNVTAKQINTQKTVQQISSSTSKTLTQSVNVKKGNVFRQQHVESKESKKDIEIFNIDDSEEEEEMHNVGEGKSNTNSSSNPQDTTTPPNKSMECLKNLSKHITIKSSNTQLPNLIKKENEGHKDTSKLSSHEDQTRTSDRKPETNFTNHEHTKLKNTLKNLSKHITVKSNNTKSPSGKSEKFTSEINQTSEDEYNSDDSAANRVKITELNDEECSDHELNETCNDQSSKNVIVEAPDDSDDNHCSGEELDSEKEVTLNKVVKQLPNTVNNKQSVNLNHLKNITIKSSKEQNANHKEVEQKPEENSTTPNPNELALKPYRAPLTKRPGPASRTMNQFMKANAEVHQTAVNQRASTSSQINTVNKVVKTFQNQTVIEEITTTVTKTIRTVNQTVQQMSHTSNSSSMVRPQGYRQPRPLKNFQGVTVRQTSPLSGPRIRNPQPVRPTGGTMVRPSNQLVPVKAGVNITRPNRPRMPRPPVRTPQPTMVGKPLKISPNAMVTPRMKRPTEDTSGPFSCFKKPKESLIPVPEIPGFDDDQETDGSLQFASSSHMSKSNVVTSTKMMKGNSVVTKTQMKSEECASSQQLNKVGGLSGLKIMKTSQARQATQVEENCEMTASKRSALEAIEKLKKQGLLIKKPRPDEEAYSNHSHSGGDDDYP